MQIDISTEEIEKYAANIAKRKIRDQIKDLVKSDLEAMSNFTDIKNQIMKIGFKVNDLDRRISALEEASKKKRWLKK